MSSTQRDVFLVLGGFGIGVTLVMLFVIGPSFGNLLAWIGCAVCIWAAWTSPRNGTINRA